MAKRRSPVTTELLTLSQFEMLPEPGEFRLELSRGVLVREPQPGARHGMIVVELLVELIAHVREHDLGRVSVEAGFLLADDPPTVRRPDVAYISYDRWPAGALPEGLWPLAPDLAVEVVSPSNTAADIHEKALQYLDAGSGVVWVVQPRTRTIEVWQGSAGIAVVREDGVLEGGDVLPGFWLEIGRLFERR